MAVHTLSTLDMFIHLTIIITPQVDIIFLAYQTGKDLREVKHIVKLLESACETGI